MSALSDAVKAIRDVMLLQAKVANLERTLEGQSIEIRKMAHDLIQVDKRVVRIEALVEAASMASGRKARPPRIER